jgi:hypothetical protein
MYKNQVTQLLSINPDTLNIYSEKYYEKSLAFAVHHEIKNFKNAM